MFKCQWLYKIYVWYELHMIVQDMQDKIHELIMISHDNFYYHWQL